jgi:hypothetical protein
VLFALRLDRPNFERSPPAEDRQRSVIYAMSTNVPPSPHVDPPLWKLLLVHWLMVLTRIAQGALGEIPYLRHGVRRFGQRALMFAARVLFAYPRM